MDGALLSGGRLGHLPAVLLRDPAYKLSGGAPDDPRYCSTVQVCRAVRHWPPSFMSTFVQ